jgi:hypothetical protein
LDVNITDSSVCYGNPSTAAVQRNLNAAMGEVRRCSNSSAYSFSKSNLSETGDDIAVNSQCLTLGSGDMRKNWGIVHHKPGTICSNINVVNTTQNQKANIDSISVFHHQKPGGYIDLGSHSFEHLNFSVPKTMSMSKHLPNRHGVVHHRPVNPSAAADARQYSLNQKNQGAFSCGANSNFEQTQASHRPGAKVMDNVVSANFQNISSQANKTLMNSGDTGGIADAANVLVKASDYASLNELNRITKTVCNCVTCGRHLSCAIDIWSVGCLALEMFLGRREPHSGGRSKCENCLGYETQMLCKVSVDAGNLIKIREEDQDLEQRIGVLGDLKDLVQRCVEGFGIFFCYIELRA